ncbi:MAG: response regulator [Caulobacteraceae bacterium]|nr:response regulator [Caulobacteraceae bacterium]
MRNLFDLAEIVEPIAPDAPGSAAFDRFQAEPGLLSIAVVDAAGAPLGLIERHDFSLKMAGQYGRALYAGRPVTLVMNPEARVVDGETAIKDFTHEAQEATAADLLRGFIITCDGRYFGVGSALSLLQAQNLVIRHQAQEAKAALRAKSEFLAVMSHEIRTPLNGVLAVADVVARQLTQEPLRPYVETIISSGETLMRLLNDALDLSRAEAGRLELEERDFRIGAMLSDVDALWRARAAEAGLGFSTRFEGDETLWALGDAVRVKQVLNNLVGNALKFTTEGAVGVNLSARRDDIYVVLTAEVSDTGPGIAPEDVQRLFQPFSQTEAGRAAGGAGLGLSICRQLVEKMGGELTVHSEIGRGSTFALRVVLFHVENPGLKAAAEPLKPEEAASAAHVLIADDNATNRMVAETLCDMFGCTHESVENGAEALELTRTGRFDLILMDIMMPVMDGLEATRSIREAGEAWSSVPIIALTANADPFDAESYRAQGIGAVVEKPVKADLLLAAMQQVMGDGDAVDIAA